MGATHTCAFYSDERGSGTWEAVGPCIGTWYVSINDKCYYCSGQYKPAEGGIPVLVIFKLPVVLGI